MRIRTITGTGITGFCQKICMFSSDVNVLEYEMKNKNKSPVNMGGGLKRYSNYIMKRYSLANCKSNPIAIVQSLLK